MSNVWQDMKDASAWGAWKNANDRLNSGKELSEQEKNYLAGVKKNAVASGIMSAAQGINGILNPALQAAQIGDTTMYQYDIANVAELGTGPYYDWDQLGGDYANANLNIKPIEVDDVRGMSTKEKWGAGVTGALAGAQAGMAIGGPWGALAGGVLGAGAAAIGIISGNRKAEREAMNLNNQADIAQQYAKQNFDAAFERVADRQNRIGQSNIAAEGGKMSKAAKSKHMTIQQFADNVLSKQNADKYSDTIMKHKYSAGGKTYNTHGGYFAPDIVKIENGGTHEQNPFGGVQVGVDPMGVPNLVEEGEIIYDDYVFSDRLNASESLLKEFSLPEKYAGKSFAYIADRLSAEAKERSNDAISNNGMAAMYDRLMAAQDYHKEKLEMARVKRELNKLSPEEQQAVADAMFGLQPMPEQEAMPMQEPMPEQPMMEGMPVMAAYGGQLANKFVLGGDEDGDRQNLLTRLTLGAMMADSPAVATASGWTYDENGNIVQTDQDTEGAAALRSNLAEIATLPMYETGLGVAGQGIRALRGLQTADEIVAGANRAVRAATRTAKGAATVGKTSGEISSAAKARDAAKSAVNVAKQNAATAREEIKTAAMKQATATTSKARTAAGKSLDKATQKLIDAESDAVKYTQEARRAGWNVAGKEIERAGQQAWNAVQGVPPALRYPVGIAAPVAAGIGIHSTLVDNNQNEYVPADNSSTTNNDTQFFGYDTPRQTMNPYVVNGQYTGGPRNWQRDAVNSGNYNPWIEQPLGESGPSATTTGLQIPSPASYSAQRGSNVSRVDYGSGRDKEYQVPYINFVDYMRGQVNDGVLSDNGKAMLSRIYGGNPDDYDINNFNDWLKNATDGIDGKIHDATLKVANDWSDSIATSRFDEPLPNLARPEDPYFNYTPSLMRDPEAEARVRQRQIENINNTPSEGGSAENDDFTPLPTWMRYAGVGYNLLSGLHNMFQEPDRYQYRQYTPDTVEGQLALDRLQYNPYDFNIANNQINANAAATNLALQNAGMGPSAGAALLAANYNNARNFGNSYWQTRLANQQQLANVTQANNQAAQAEADFDYRRNLANTQIRNQAALYNLQNAMQTDMWNKQAESQKWQAVSQSMDASAQDLANIGRENFNMNMVNSNPALFYFIDPSTGMVDYKKWAAYNEMQKQKQKA